MISRKKIKADFREAGLLSDILSIIIEGTNVEWKSLSFDTRKERSLDAFLKLRYGYEIGAVGFRNGAPTVDELRYADENY